MPRFVADYQVVRNRALVRSTKLWLGLWLKIRLASAKWPVEENRLALPHQGLRGAAFLAVIRNTLRERLGR